MAIRGNRYKILHCWYLTPYQLSKMYPNQNHVCWKFGHRNATYIHMWWDCHKVKKKNRQMVHEVLEAILHIIVPFTCQTFLLCWVEDPFCIKYKYLLINFITATTLLLALYWKNESVTYKIRMEN